MKKLGLLVLSSAAMFAACTSETDVQNVSPKDAISFNTTLKGVTRTVYTNETFDKFKVVALKSTDGTKEFEDDVVKVSASKWATTEIQHWPAYELSFFAYAPTDLNAIIGASSKGITEFVPNSALADQQDIVTAFNKGTKAANQNGVDLKFRHALTQIEILATNEDVLRYKVDVLGSKLVRVKSKGTMTFPADANSAASWTVNGETTASYGDKLPAPITLDATPQRVMTDGNNWMMLPQQLDAWNLKPTKTENNEDNNGAYIAVLLRITQLDNGKAIYPTKKGEAVSANFAYAAIPVSTNWKLGYKYTYTLKFFGAGGGAGFVAGELTTPNVDGVDSDVDTQPLDNWDANTMIGQPIIDGVINFNVQIEEWQDGTTTTETIEN